MEAVKRVFSSLDYRGYPGVKQFPGQFDQILQGHDFPVTYPLSVEVDRTYAEKSIDDILFACGKSCIGIVA